MASSILLRSRAAVSLVHDMADHGAFASRGRDFHVYDEHDVTATEKQYLDELLANELAMPTNAEKGFYTLTSKASYALRPSVKLSCPVLLHHFCRDISDDAMSCYELSVGLQRNGWNDMESVSPASVQAYCIKGAKVWYRHPSKPVSKNYLRVLLQSDHFFKHGLLEIHHMQPEMCHDIVNMPTKFFLTFDTFGIKNTYLSKSTKTFSPSSSYVLSHVVVYYVVM